MILAEIKITKRGAIKKLALVKTPAVEIDYLKMNKEILSNLKMSINEERQIITGPALIPDRRYPRSAKFFNNIEDGYIFFSKDTVKEIAIDFLRGGNLINIEHDDNQMVSPDDIEIVESWIIETEEDKAYSLGFSKEDCPMGTWMVTQHINSDNLWKDVKAGKLNGYSIQGSPTVDIIAKGLGMSEDCDKEEMPEALQPLILAHLKRVGQTLEQLQADGYEMVNDDVKMAIESDPNAESTLDNSKRLVRYYYKGPKDDKNRKFCAEVLALNLWYRKEDINYLSFKTENKDFGTYSIFKYAGSYGCRHTWDRNYFSPSMKFSKEKEQEEKIYNIFMNIINDYIKK